VSLTGIDHVQLAMPRGGEAAARAFYGDVLGLQEVAKPPALVDRGGCWFLGAGGGPAIHVGVEEPFHPARKAHVALVVDGLAELRTRLERAGVVTLDDDRAIGVRRFYAIDPFGNRLELVESTDAGFTRWAGMADAGSNAAADSDRRSPGRSCRFRPTPFVVLPTGGANAGLHHLFQPAMGRRSPAGVVWSSGTARTGRRR
jgi:catechol 2,3-dioxygenase-like lactoylglutathione lyase family enzyme